MALATDHTDFNWLADHGLELYEKYRGKWIAVCEAEVVAVGDTAVEAAEAAERACPGKRFILHPVERDTDAILPAVPLD